MSLHRQFLRLASVATALTAGSAMAQSNPYFLGVSQSLGYESNLYRVGDNQVLPADLSRSDTVSGTALVAGVDQSWGRQRLRGTGNVRANRFSRNPSLNNDSYSVDLTLDSETIERISTTLRLAADQSLAQFNNRDTAGNVETKKNVQRTSAIDGTVRLGLAGPYSLEASLGHRDRRYSAAEYNANEYRQTKVALGMRWRPSSIVQFGAALRATQATYPRFRLVAPEAYQSDVQDRHDIEFSANWEPKGQSLFSLRLSPTRARFRRDTASDYSGLTGSALWAWQATGKIKLTTVASHDTNQNSDAVSLGIVGKGLSDFGRTSTSLSSNATFDFSAKIGLTAGLSYTHRALSNSLTLPGNTAVERTGGDDTTNLSLGARWAPTRAIQLGCDVGAERRTTSNPQLSVPLSGKSFSCFGQFTLQ